MNILLINHYAGSNRHGMEYRPFYLAREWVSLGHQVSIVAASCSHVRTQAPRITGDATEEKIEGIRYLWLKTPGYRANGIGRVANILAFVSQLVRQRAALIRNGRPDIVIASSTYPLDVIPARRIAQKCAAQLIYEVHDLWPLSPIELGGMSPGHPFIMLMQWAENFAYRNADRVASMLPKAEDHMRRHGLGPDKFAYLPNGIDTAEWQSDLATMPPAHRAALARMKAEGRFIVGYAGAHGLANALHTLLEAAQHVQRASIGFVLVGQGPEKEALQLQARRLGLMNTEFLPPVPKRCMPALLASMDVLYIGLKRTPIFRFGISPNKLMDYMMAGKPVIQAIEAGNDMVVESECGVSVPPEDPAAVAKAVLQLMSVTPADRRAMGMRGRKYVLANHDYRMLAQRFLSIMQSPK
jgi:glycosyltransferase involved in cell wall biosynthesis